MYLQRSSKLKNTLVQFIMIPIKINIAIQGIWASFYLSKNIIKMHPRVKPRVNTLKVEKVKVIISKGFVKGD